jgi:hypothetical protein
MGGPPCQKAFFALLKGSDKKTQIVDLTSLRTPNTDVTDIKAQRLALPSEGIFAASSFSPHKAPHRGPGTRRGLGKHRGLVLMNDPTLFSMISMIRSANFKDAFEQKGTESRP